MKFFMTRRMLPDNRFTAIWGRQLYEAGQESMFLRDYPNGTYFFMHQSKSWHKHDAGRLKDLRENSVPNEIKLLVLIHGGPA